jgi:peptidylprolyl isomerase
MNRALVLSLVTLACGSPPPSVEPSPIASTMPSLQGDTIAKSGMKFIEIAAGTGAQVQRNRCVYAHYTGWLASNGRQFDSSRDTTADGHSKPPIGFALGIRQVIAGWDVGFEGMQVGGKRRLFIPWHMAYGARGAPPVIPGRADLIFDVEVVGTGPAQLTRPDAASALRCPSGRGG